MKELKNKKGFTLVELLAVIVILALIMSIAIISMSGIMQSARQSTFKETALQIINGVRDSLQLANESNPGDSAFSTGNGVDFYFTKDIVEKGGDTAPLGGKIQYIDTPTLNSSATDQYKYKVGTIELKQIGTMGVYRGKTSGTCSAASKSFVRVSHNGTNFVYSICLTAGDGYKYIGFSSNAAENSTEANLLDNNNVSMILPH